MNATIENYVAQDSLTNPDYTWSASAISCLRGALIGHYLCVYVVFLSGLGCILTRLVPGRPEWRLHSWCGWLYIVSMIWALGTSILIHNTGMPPAILFSFFFCLSGLTIGWFLIRLHQYKMQRKTLQVVTEKMNAGMKVKTDLASLLREESQLITRQRTFYQNVFSYKMFHACFMITSWINIAGRVFSTNLGQSFTCYTIPAYKPISTTHGDFRSTSDCLQPVQTYVADFNKLPWGMISLTLWSVILSIVPFLAVFLIYAIYIKLSSKCRKENKSLQHVAEVTKPTIDTAFA